MKKKAYIQVPNPCHENWQEMTPVEQGRHCGVCAKNVIDFTKFTDKELLDFLSTPKQNICGRFNNKQLDREITYPLQPKKYSFPTTWLFGLSLLAGTVATSLPITTYANHVTIEKPFLNVETKNTDGDSTRVIKGVVTDSLYNNEPLIGVSILIKDTKIGASTDFDGNFTLKIPEKYINKDVTFQVRYVGYETKFITVKQNQNNIKVALREANIEMGEVVIQATFGKMEVIDLNTKEKIKKERKIVGSVFSDFDSLPVSSATIAIQGTEYKAKTDAEGNFSLNMPLIYFDSTFNLEVTLAGFKTLIVTDYKYTFTNKPLNLILHEAILGSCEVIVVPETLSRWQKIKRFFRRLF